MIRVSQICIAVGLFAACNAETDVPDVVADMGRSDAVAAQDVTIAGDSAAARDVAAQDVPPATRDVAARDAPPASDAGAVQWWRAQRLDGGVVQGELVATYDMSRWWNPRPAMLYGLFDGRRYAPYPDDRSFQFVSSDEIESFDAVPAPAMIEPYQAFLRARGIYFQRPPLQGPAFVITANETYHLDEDGFGDFAWDFVQTDDSGVRYTGSGAANEDYFVWAEPVLSGVAGVVIDVVAVGTDNEPGAHPEPATAVNNLVGISLGGSFYAYYLHFQENGVDPSVTVNDVVAVGDILGITGNSGVSLEPHVHVVLLWYDAQAQRSYSVPVEFHTIAVADQPVGPFQEAQWATPVSGTWLTDSE